jgi:hypothetical protein
VAFSERGEPLATLNDFASLLQLGVGIGIGLLAFRAPMDLRVGQLSKALDEEFRVFSGGTSDKALSALQEIASLQLEFNETCIKLERWNRPFMAITILVALGNWVALIFASLYASTVLTCSQESGLLTLSVFYYVVIWLILEALARWQLRGVQSKLKALRAS